MQIVLPNHYRASQFKHRSLKKRTPQYKEHFYLKCGAKVVF
jgi:hypothetical protein